VGQNRRQLKVESLEQAERAIGGRGDPQAATAALYIHFYGAQGLQLVEPLFDGYI
jgi:hypothetical protein